MNKALKISIYVAGSVSTVLLANQLTKLLNSGKGFLTTDKQMGTYVGMSKFGRNKPYTKENIGEFLEWWETVGKGYKIPWYKAVWKSEHGKPQEFFYNSEGKKFNTLGGSAA